MNKDNNKIEFDAVAADGVCESCGKKTKVVVVASAIGPVSNAVCKGCLNKRLEPIGNIAGLLTVSAIDSYEKLMASKTLHGYVEGQMQARNASDDDWNDLWSVVKSSIEMMDRLAEEDEVH